MNKRYDQPFFVGRNNPRFRGVSIDGYLPALEISHQEILPIIPPEHKLYNELQQLKGRFIHLQNQYNKHLDKKKKVYHKYIS